MSADVQVRPVDEPLTPPFGGAQIWEPAIDAVYPYIERMSLLVGRWGFKKGEWFTEIFDTSHLLFYQILFGFGED